MRIINCTNHIDVICNSFFSIEASTFLNIGSNVKNGGAIFLQTSQTASFTNVQFDECVAQESGGGMYLDVHNCALKKICFSHCTHWKLINLHEGSAAYILIKGLCSMSFSNIFRCSPFSNSGFLSVRFWSNIVKIDNINCTHSKNKQNGAFGLAFLSEGSFMKYSQLSNMTDNAFHIDDGSNISISMCNVVDNKDYDCFAIRVFSSSESQAMTFIDLVLWGNTNQIHDYYNKAVHKFIRCLTDKDFSGFVAEECQTNLSKVNFFKVDAPNNCKYERTTLGRRCRRLIGLCFGLMGSSDAKH